MITIITKEETARRCGFRNPGGLYLVADGYGTTCFKLPIPLTVCPHCGEGIKQSRGFTWITSKIIDEVNCRQSNCNDGRETLCPLSGWIKKFALLWVGEKFYSNAIDFSREAKVKGISKRIAQIPREMKIGESWVLLAHPKAVAVTYETEGGKPFVVFEPGIFHAFMPTRIEYILTGQETEEELQQLTDRGLTLINLKRIETIQTTIEEKK